MKKLRNKMLRRAFLLCMSFVMLSGITLLFPERVAAEGAQWVTIDIITGEYLAGEEYNVSQDFIDAANEKLIREARGTTLYYEQKASYGVLLNDFDASYIDIHNFADRWDSEWKDKLTEVTLTSQMATTDKAACIPITATTKNEIDIQIADAMLSWMFKEGSFTAADDNKENGYVLNFYDPSGNKTGKELLEDFPYELISTCFPHLYLGTWFAYNAKGQPGTMYIRQSWYGDIYHWAEEKMAVLELVNTFGSTPAEIRKNANDYLCDVCYYYNPDNPGVPEQHAGQFPYCALVEGDPVCNGYALAYSLLCLSNGVDMRYVSGRAGGGHAWNLFYKEETNDTTLYMTDVTWNDPGGYYPNTGKYTNNPWYGFFEKTWASVKSDRSLTLGETFLNQWFAKLDEIDEANTKTFEPQTGYDYTKNVVDYEAETVTIPKDYKYSAAETLPGDWTAITTVSDGETAIALDLPNDDSAVTFFFYDGEKVGMVSFKRPAKAYLSDTDNNGGKLSVENTTGFEYDITEDGAAPTEWADFGESYTNTDLKSTETLYYRKKATDSAFASPILTLADNASVQGGTDETDPTVVFPDDDAAYPAVEPASFGEDPVIYYSETDSSVYLKFDGGTSKYWEYSKAAKKGYKSAIAVLAGEEGEDESKKTVEFADITALVKNGKPGNATAGDVKIYVRHKSTETSEAGYPDADTDNKYLELSAPIEGRPAAPAVQVKFKLQTSGDGKGTPLDGDAKFNNKDIVFDPFTDSLNFKATGKYIIKVGGNNLVYSANSETPATMVLKLSDFDTIAEFDLGLENLSAAETIYISIAGSNGVAKYPTSKEAKLAIPAKSTAPKASVDFTKNTVKGLSAAMEYRIAAKDEGVLKWTEWADITDKTLDLSAIPTAEKIAVRTKATYAKRVSESKVLDLGVARAKVPAFALDIAAETIEISSPGTTIYEYRINKYKKTSATDATLIDNWTAWTAFGTTQSGTKKIDADGTINIAALGAIPNYNTKASGSGEAVYVNNYVLQVRVKGINATDDADGVKASASKTFVIKPRAEIKALALQPTTKYIQFKVPSTETAAIPTDLSYEYYMKQSDGKVEWKDVTGNFGGTANKGTYYVRKKADSDYSNSATVSITVK
ncbi:MAG: hypothetical protein LBM87_02675 [Ruminococcus sp.]|nr:hypothetical protein [Ruminococcus sp.]